MKAYRQIRILLTGGCPRPPRGIARGRSVPPPSQRRRAHPPTPPPRQGGARPRRTPRAGRRRGSCTAAHNEPRAVGVDPAGYRRWLKDTAALLKRLAPRQLVTIGTEGTTPFGSYVGTNFTLDSSDPNIDYTTIHIWPQNWNWYDPVADAGDVSKAVDPAAEYFEEHARMAGALGKPLVLEEFGLARDGGSFGPAAPVGSRDAFYDAMVNETLRLGAAGLSPWAFSGSSRPAQPPGTAAAGGCWTPGSPLLGDPPHELQGWYSVYDADATTMEVLKRAAARLAPDGAGGA